MPIPPIKTLNQPEKEKIIQGISEYLHRHYSKIVFAFLFGSFASKPSFADIDLAVFTAKDVTRPLDFEIELEIRLRDIAGYPVDVRILNRAPISFCQNVFRHGRIILDKEPNLRADFESRILKQHFDFSPFQQSYLKEVIHAPV